MRYLCESCAWTQHWMDIRSPWTRSPPWYSAGVGAVKILKLGDYCKAMNSRFLNEKWDMDHPLYKKWQHALRAYDWQWFKTIKDARTIKGRDWRERWDA